jgi:hypothetical protein
MATPTNGDRNMTRQTFAYKGFIVDVERRTILTDPRQGWTWGKKRSIASFSGYNPETNQRVDGSGAKRKAMAKIDSMSESITA